MEMVKISIQTWHYKWLDKLGMIPRFGADTCTYRLAMIKASILSLFILAAAVIFLISAGDFLAWAAACVVSLSFFTPNPIAALGAAAVLIALGILTLALIAVLSRQGAFNSIKPSPAMVKLYQSWRDKFCVPVEYVYEDSKK